MQELTAYETSLLEYLRREAQEVKNCFTQFSFQVIAVSAVALGLLTRFQPNFPLLGLAGVSVILMALAVGRIGTYKYATANRIHGYELYLDRVRRLRDTPGWKNDYRQIGWEEAMRAWRTVQPTVFRLYYEWGPNRANFLKKEYRNIAYRWFEPAKLHHDGTVYYAGSYLRTMLSILYMLLALGVASMLFMTFQVLRDPGAQVEAVIITPITAGILSVVVIKVRQLSQRRRLLEGGILSINSCAIVWHLVVTCHHRAIASLPTHDESSVASFEGYTSKLSEQAASLKQHLQDGKSPHTWIHGPSAPPPAP